jgi:TRAP-type C4-dicarboxylate transport system substrate-binding protein
MKYNKLLLLCIMLLLASMSMVVGCTKSSTTSAPTGGVITWRLQSAFPATDNDNIINASSIANDIETASGGKIKVELYPMGVLCAPEDITDAVSKGAIEIGQQIAGSAADKVPSAVGSEMPFGVQNREQAWELFHNYGMADIMRDEYAKQGIYLLTQCHNGSLCLMTTFPVNTVDDLKGKKLWAHPSAFWLSDFGAASVDVPGMDMYMALKLGTIDGMTWTLAELTSTKLEEVVKYVMYPQIITPQTHVLINMKAWNAIGPDLQKKIQDYVDAHWDEAAAAYDAANDTAVAEAKAYGVIFTTLDSTDLTKLTTDSRSFWDDIASLSPDAAKMVNLYKQYLKDKNIPY